MSWRVPAANETRNILGSQTLGGKADSAGHGSVIGWLKSLVRDGLIVGQPWFVDSVSGLATYDGKAFTQSKATIATAVALASANDTIFLRGSFNEAVSCALAGVRFIGIGTNRKQAAWTAPTVAGSFCLQLAAQYCHVENLYMQPVAYTTSGVPAGISLSGANYATIKNVRFQGKTGSYKAIYSAVCNSDNVEIDGCDFMYLNTATHGAAIWLVNAGGLSYSGWKIKSNRIAAPVTGIKGNFRSAEIVGNSVAEYGVNAAGAIAAVLALGIDLSGNDPTNSGGNMVWGNQLGGAYDATLYKVGAAGDQWGGNYNVLTGGLTAANPA